MVKLKNLLRRMRSFNLEHPSFLAMKGDNGVGEPETLTLLALETREVPPAALECAEIKAALSATKGRRATLRVVK